jgi:predicted transcriptional regulator
VAVSDFQRTLMNILRRQRLSVANLAEHTGYNPSLLERLVAGRAERYRWISLYGLPIRST